MQLPQFNSPSHPIDPTDQNMSAANVAGYTTQGAPRALHQRIRSGLIHEAQSLEPRLLGCVACQQMHQLRETAINLLNLQVSQADQSGRPPNLY